ncbi:hypothetical protein Dimus_035327, partial [Dionaea muscipula]
GIWINIEAADVSTCGASVNCDKAATASMKTQRAHGSDGRGIMKTSCEPESMNQ